MTGFSYEQVVLVDSYQNHRLYTVEVLVVMFFLICILFACRSDDPWLMGTWILDSSEAKGEIIADRTSLQVGVWGKGWSTIELVDAKIAADKDVFWLYFPLQTGLGEGEASLRLQGHEAMLSLGSRAGEFDISFEANPTGRWTVDKDKWIKNSRKTVEKEQAYWQAGGFLLQADGKTTGVLRYIHAKKPMVMVFDEHWYTPKPQLATAQFQGADLLVSFAVEPNLQGENALLQINVPTRQVVVPMGEMPSRLDRRLQLVPGYLQKGERKQLRQKAIKKANQQEKKWVETNAKELLRKVGCIDWNNIEETRRLPWKGYKINMSKQEGLCIFDIRPVTTQHRRRLTHTFQFQQ